MFRNKLLDIIVLSTFFTTLLFGCGSESSQDNVQQKPTQSSSQAASSSSVSNSELNVEFVFPTQHANLGSVEHTHIKLLATLNNKEVTVVNVGDVNFRKTNDGYWINDVDKLMVVNVDDQHFDVVVQDEEGSSYRSELILNNSMTGVAGSGPSLFANSLAFDNSNHILVSDVYEGALISVDLASSDRSKIQQLKKPDDYSKPLHWPVRFDSLSGHVYLLSDYYEYNEELGKETYKIELNIGNLANSEFSTSPLITNSEINRLSSVNSFVLDVNNEIPSHTLALEGKSSIYALDYEANSPLKRIILETGRTLAMSVQQDVESQLAALNKVKGILRYGPESLLILRSQSGNGAIAEPSILKINFDREDLDFDGVPESTTITSTQFSGLDNGLNTIQTPTAMALNQDQTTLYIADQDKIWAMDLTQESKPFELLTSSSIIPGKKGQGPRLGSSITAMEVHPEHDVLYIAAGAQGIMAVDLETGDRITVAK